MKTLLKYTSLLCCLLLMACTPVQPTNNSAFLQHSQQIPVHAAALDDMKRVQETYKAIE